MADQLYIDDDGGIGDRPRTWDGEPLYGRETVAESQHLFAPGAFEQMPGQMALEAEENSDVR